jgi:hypothetical protein
MIVFGLLLLVASTVPRQLSALPVGVALIAGGVLLWRYSSRYIDTVWDCGYYLLVQRGRAKESISIRNIEGVTYRISAPPRITLCLRVPSAFGSKIGFVPLGNPWRSRRLAKDLKQRVHFASAG